MKRILFLGCHLDDIEYGCGGVITKLNRQHKDAVQLAFLTLSTENRDARGNITITRDVEESKRALAHIGITDDAHCFLGMIPGQKFQYYTQDVREELLKMRQLFDPDYIFMPSTNDIHQDHKVLAEEGFRIFRNRSCIGYEIIRSCFYLQPNLFVELSDEDLQCKIKAIAEYQSQLQQSAGYYFSEDVIKSIAIAHGARCGKTYVEAFEINTLQI